MNPMLLAQIPSHRAIPRGPPVRARALIVAVRRSSTATALLLGCGLSSTVTSPFLGSNIFAPTPYDSNPICVTQPQPPPAEEGMMGLVR